MEVVSEAVSKPEKCTIIFCKQDLLLYIFRKAVRVSGGSDMNTRNPVVEVHHGEKWVKKAN